MLRRPAMKMFVSVVCILSGVALGHVAETVMIPTKSIIPEGKMPVVGLGTFQIGDEESVKAVEYALDIGYRHFDTATIYQNEFQFGKILNKWISDGKGKREDLYITTKLPPFGMTPAGVEKYLTQSLRDLQVDYLDMYLIHCPVAYKDIEKFEIPKNPEDVKLELDLSVDHIAVWKALEAQVESGKVKAIGLSNFNITQMDRILKNSMIKPSNLQTEIYPYNQQKEVVDYAQKHGIVVTAYSPLGSPHFSKVLAEISNKKVHNLFENPIVKEIAKKHGVTEAQAALRHGIQRGLVVIPKSANKNRLKQNIDIFNFELDNDDMEKFNGLDMGEEGRVFDLTNLPGAKDHPEYPF